MGAERSVIERLLDSEIKAELLILFHKNPGLQETVDGIARRLGRPTAQVEKEFQDLVKLGLLKKTEVYSYNAPGDQDIQRSILAELSGAATRAATLPVATTFKAQVPIIDDLLRDGYPSPSLTLVQGDPGAGKTRLACQFATASLHSHRTAIFFTLDAFPATIRDYLTSLVPESATASNLYVVDCHSYRAGVLSSEKYYQERLNLTDLSLLITKLLNEEAASHPLLVLDSVNALVDQFDLRNVLEFLRGLAAKIHHYSALGLVTLNRRAYPLAILAAIQDIVDVVIELKTEEEARGLRNYLRITKLRGALSDQRWRPYIISPTFGLAPQT